MSKILRKFSLQIPSFQTYEDVLKMDAPLLTKGLDEFLSLELPSWTKSGQKIEKNYEFINFKQTFGFMTEVALFADYIDHHPDWSNVYNKLQVRLNSHYCNGITMRDLFLAYTMDKIQEKQMDLGLPTGKLYEIEFKQGNYLKQWNGLKQIN